ncbi:PilZ domain-containing protein, partial [Elusimicrobiota bacterium]
LALEVEVRVFDGEREFIDACVTDISSEGLGLYIPGRVHFGQRLRIQLETPGGGVSGVGVVRWASPHHLGYRGGVQLQRLGWRGWRRLNRYLSPSEFFDWSAAFDSLLLGLAVIVILIAVFEFLGITPSDLFSFLDPMKVG